MPHITVRKAPPSVAFTDRMGVRMRKRAWPRGIKLRGGIERRGGKCGQHRRAHDAGYAAAHFPQSSLRFFSQPNQGSFSLPTDGRVMETRAIGAKPFLGAVAEVQMPMAIRWPSRGA